MVAAGFICHMEPAFRLTISLMIICAGFAVAGIGFQCFLTNKNFHCTSAVPVLFVLPDLPIFL
jgi:hypothetical protein